MYCIDPEIIISKNLPIVNYNTGKFSKGIVNQEYNTFEQIPLENHKNIVDAKDKIILEKEKIISLLTRELDNVRMEKAELFELLKKHL